MRKKSALTGLISDEGEIKELSVCDIYFQVSRLRKLLRSTRQLLMYNAVVEKRIMMMKSVSTKQKDVSANTRARAIYLIRQID